VIYSSTYNNLSWFSGYCEAFGSYVAGEVVYHRTCSYTSSDTGDCANAAPGACEAYFGEEYIHGLATIPNSPEYACYDTGFIRQMDDVFSNSCPF
jgi:hypothetical protein